MSYLNQRRGHWNVKYYQDRKPKYNSLRGICAVAIRPEVFALCSSSCAKSLSKRRGPQGRTCAMHNSATIHAPPSWPYESHDSFAGPATPVQAIFLKLIHRAVGCRAYTVDKHTDFANRLRLFRPRNSRTSKSSCPGMGLSEDPGRSLHPTFLVFQRYISSLVETTSTGPQP